MLVTQSFGKEYEYRRAVLAIWSYWAHCPQANVLLFTDAPDFFRRYFDGKPVEYVLLTPPVIREMRGSIDFLHRMKISILEEAFKRTAENLLYVDSDTFFTTDPTPIVDQISAKQSFMHLREYRFDSLKEMKMPAGEPFLAFLNLIVRNSFHDSNGKTTPVTPLHYSWNAGVMMFHPSVRQLLPDVYALTDQFYPATRNHASEQYAFSIVLQNNMNVEPCDSVVYHYWYRVKKQIVDAFLAEQVNDSWAQLPIARKEQAVLDWVKLLPSYLDNHVLSLRDTSIQAFNEREYLTGYAFAFRAIIKNPWNWSFIKDVLYHTRRLLSGKKY